MDLKLGHSRFLTLEGLTEFTPGCFVKSITSPGSHILLTLCCMAIYLGYLLQSRKGGFASPVIFSDMTINQLIIYFSGNLATESATKEDLVRRFPTSYTRTPGWTRRSYKQLWKIERSGGRRCNNSSIKHRRLRQGRQALHTPLRKSMICST